MKVRPALQPLDQAQRYSLEEAAAYLRVSKWTLHAFIREGRLQSIKEGRRRFIHGSEIARHSRATQV